MYKNIDVQNKTLTMIIYDYDLDYKVEITFLLVKVYLTLKDRAPIRTLSDWGEGRALSRKLL